MRTIKTIIVIYAMLTTFCYASSYFLESNWIKADDDTYINPVQLIKEHGDYLYVCGNSLHFFKEVYKAPKYDSDGKLIVVVRTKSYQPRIASNQSVYPKRSGIVRLKKDGTIDKEWSSVFFNDVQVLAFDIMPDGKLVVAIDSINNNSTLIAEFDSFGNMTKLIPLEKLFPHIVDFQQPPKHSDVVQIRVINSYIYIIGDFGRYPKNSIDYPMHIIRLSSDYSIDTTFNAIGTRLFGTAIGIEFQRDGKIIIYGNLKNYRKTYSYHLCRLNPDGTYDYTFNTLGIGFNSTVRDCIVLPDNSLLVGGYFTEYNNLPVSNCICKLTADGQIDKSFNRNVYGVWDNFSNHFSVETITPISGNRFLVGGMFSRYNHQDVYNLIMIDSSGQLLESFDELLEYKLFRVHTICESANGDLYVGGACFIENCDTNKQIGILKFSKSKGFVEFYLLYLSIICILGIAVFLIIRFRRKFRRSN